MKIALISCCARKKKHSCQAQDLYDSKLFTFSLNYAKKIKSDKIFILSAKYGLLELTEQIEPYNETLNNFDKEKRKSWANFVLSKLKLKTDLNNDDFTILAGKRYREFILPYIKKYYIPLERLTIGNQLKYLKENIYE